jgi:1-aminocyclopropane-1-carboxylate deaminase
MYKNIATQTLRKSLLKTAGIRADVLRLDLMDPVISGNKWFKLKYHIQEALEQHKKGIVSFGGAFSNHLVALAESCKQHGLRSTGIIRGSEKNIWNVSLEQMKRSDMELLFVSRDEYNLKEDLTNDFLISHPDYYYVPEGGQSSQGIRGASEILSYAKPDYSHIVCAIGTGTTAAGIIHACQMEQECLGISSLKVSNSSSNQLLSYLSSVTRKNNYSVNFDYHFGGYAKKTRQLISFMNELYIEENIPTDFVYTAKMFFGTFDLISKGFFSAGSKILLIHSGGLQGNRSLPAGTLVF